MGTRICLFLLLFAGIFPLDSITVEGNRILPAAAIVRASGLKAGDAIDSPAAFDAARDRLLASGYFETVAYRYRAPAKEGKYEITFEVKETPGLYPPHVEALGVTTEAVNAYLKAKDPLFLGRLPATKPALDRTAREIEQMLGGREEVAGRVITTGPDEFQIEFAPKRGVPVVATVEFEGSKAISPLDLRNKIAEVAFGQPFTEAGFRVFLDNQVRPLFEAKGYMRVRFTKIVTAASAKVQGLDVKVSVEEGEQYRLTGVNVRGGEEEHLTRVARVAAMNVADFDQVREGAERVRGALHHEGYLDADVAVDKRINDADRTVEGLIVVTPGPLYTFRRLTVNGLGLDGEAEIRKMWSVKAGDAWPQEYAKYFVSAVKKEGLFDHLGDIKATPEIDRKAHLVDVTLDFKRS